MRANASPRAATCMPPTNDARLAQNVWKWMNSWGALIHRSRTEPSVPMQRRGDDPEKANLEYIFARHVGETGIVAPKAGNINLDLPSMSDEDEFTELQKRVQLL